MFNLIPIIIMKVNVHAVNFNIDKKLVDFIDERMSKLEKYYDKVVSSDAFLKVENISEKELFRKLISVSGVGPKSALTMLSVATPQTIIRAIESGSSDNFPKTPGIGKKTLEKMILDLKGKFDNIIIENESEDMRNAKLALETLGYNARDISSTLSTLHPELDMSSLIKESLKILSGK